MLRSLFAGISGLRTNQTMLDVTGNNIANANTIGFKSSTTIFQDTLSQMLTAAAAPAPDGSRGGTNPRQVGLGVSVAAITTNFTQGSTQVTGKATDLMIQGDGFFVIGTQNADGVTFSEKYTRAGSFNFDNEGNLVAPDGSYVLGYQVDPTTYQVDDPATVANEYNAGTIPSVLPDGTGDPAAVIGKINLHALDDLAATPPLTISSFTIGADGVLRGTYSDGSQRNIAQIRMAHFDNPEGLTKVGATSYQFSPNSGQPRYGVAGDAADGPLMGGALEMSNVDLAQEFTNLILAQRGFEASSRVITTSDTILGDLIEMKR